MNSTTIGPAPSMTKEAKVPLVTVRISSNRGPPFRVVPQYSSLDTAASPNNPRALSGVPPLEGKGVLAEF